MDLPFSQPNTIMQAIVNIVSVLPQEKVEELRRDAQAVLSEPDILGNQIRHTAAQAVVASILGMNLNAYAN